MAQKMKLRELGMDTIERLYYERKDARQRAYRAKQKKLTMKKIVSVKKPRMKHNGDVFDRTLEQSICNMC